MMKNIRDWNTEKSNQIQEKTVMVLGKFDGIHLGHQKLITLAKEKAEETGEKMAVFTFSNPADTPSFANTFSNMITTEDERRKIFETMDVDYLIEAYFDEKMKTMEPEKFIEKIASDFWVTDFYIGPDFRFGYKRRGDLALLRSHAEKFGYQVHEISKEQFEKENISSTRIRESIKNSRMQEACSMLGRPYFIEGIVVTGKKLGRTLQIPTANLFPEKQKLLPKRGVYVSRTVFEDGSSRFGITNIGCRPSVNDGEQITIETNLFDYSGNLYGQRIHVEILEYLREEKKFSSVGELREQMKKDIEQAKGSLGNSKIVK